MSRVVAKVCVSMLRGVRAASKCRIASRVRSLQTLAGILACLAVLGGNTARADLMGYVDAVNAGPAHTFLATNVTTPTTADIGALSGSITYEFVVNGIHTDANSALLGADTGGQHQAIKFEQFPNTGHYGVTNYGVFDYTFGVPTTFGSDVVLDYVTNGSSTRLFVNGVDTGSTVPFALTLHGTVGIGGSFTGSGFFDVFDGSILAVATFDSALSSGEIASHSNAFFAAPVPEPASLTLLGLGAVGLAGAAWRRNRRQAV